MDYGTYIFAVTEKLRLEIRSFLDRLAKEIIQQNKTPRESTEAQRPQQTPPEIAALVNSVETIKTKQKATSDESNRWQKWTFWVQTVGTVILLAYTIYTARLYHATKRSADAATETLREVRIQFEKDQRPWIGVGNNHIAQFAPNKDYVIKIDISNSGKNPALRGWYWNKSNSAPGEGRPNASNMDDGKKHFQVGSIPPQGQREITLYWRWNEEWKDAYPFVATGKSTASNYGEIVYYSLDGAEHRTQFCLYMKDAGLPDQRLVFCNPWNEMN